jgi:hypothetical protein
MNIDDKHGLRLAIIAPRLRSFPRSISFICCVHLLVRAHTKITTNLTVQFAVLAPRALLSLSVGMLLIIQDKRRWTVSVVESAF